MKYYTAKLNIINNLTYIETNYSIIVESIKTIETSGYLKML